MNKAWRPSHFQKQLLLNLIQENMVMTIDKEFLLDWETTERPRYHMRMNVIGLIKAHERGLITFYPVSPDRYLVRPTDKGISLMTLGKGIPTPPE